SSWASHLDRSVPFGKYCRSTPFVFSFVGLCHGECGSAKNTFVPVSTANRAWSDSSLPRSHVIVFRNCCGRHVIDFVNAVAIAWAPYPASAGPFLIRGCCPYPSSLGRCTSSVERDLRSTSVPMAERFVPMM